jgi:hypothetical protein
VTLLFLPEKVQLGGHEMILWWVVVGGGAALILWGTGIFIYLQGKRWIG